MVSGSILILTAGFGEGHNAAARNLAAALKVYHPELTVAVSDIFDESYGFWNRFLQSLYRLVINRAPFLWSAFYKFLDRSPMATKGVGLFGKAALALRARIAASDANVVVSCFPGYGGVLDKVRSELHPFTYVTVVTDSLTINSLWWRCSSDYFLVPNEPTANSMERGGVDRRKICVTGFPVPVVFSEVGPIREIPPSNGIWNVLYMVNSGHDVALDIIRELLALDQIALTVTCGRNEALMQKARQLANELQKHIELHGWTSEIPSLLRRSHVLISKAGGATVQEALAAQTPLIITQVVPGQEEGNALLVVENGAGEIALTPRKITDALRGLFIEGGARYFECHQASARIGHPTGSREAANFTASLCLRG